MFRTDGLFNGSACFVVCDGNCGKAWGVTARPKVELDPKEPDDVVFLADGELGEAPADPGTYEGGHAKPMTRPSRHNKWCARQCERSETFDPGQEAVVPDWTIRRFNQPWKHPEAARTSPA